VQESRPVLIGESFAGEGAEAAFVTVLQPNLPAHPFVTPA